MMTVNEFRKLTRKQLTEMLIAQAKQIETLQQQVIGLQAKLDEREIKLSEAGNIAEAALRLNGVFESAQAACDEYVYSFKALYAREHEASTDEEKGSEESPPTENNS